MDGSMKKLNSMGQVAEKNGGQQVVNVTYGHYGSGKTYSYYGQNKRAGDIVTPEVTNPKSGKTYKTLAVVQSTHTLPQGEDTVSYLSDKDIGMKSIGKTNQRALPGYYNGWEKDAKAAYDLKTEVLLRDDIPKMQKLSLLREIKKMRK